MAAAHRVVLEVPVLNPGIALRLLAGIMVRLLYVLDRFDGAHGGTEGQFVALLQGLDPARVQASVTLLRAGAPLQRLLPNVSIRELGLKRLLSGKALACVGELRRTVREQRVEIVHTYFNDASLLIPAGLAGCDTRIVISRRDMGFWHTTRTRLISRLNTPLVDAYVCNCDAVAKSVRRNEWSPEHKIAVIHNALLREPCMQPRAQVRARLGLTADELIVGMVANLRRVKRILDAVRAMGQLRGWEGKWRLVLVGEPDPREGPDGDPRAIRALATELGIGDRVTLMGITPDPMSVIHALDVGLLCSQSEGLSNTLLEYAAAGVPIVCTDTGGNRDIVEQGESGFVVPVGDVGAIASAVAKLMRDPALRQVFGARSVVRVGAKFSRSQMVAAHQELYERLCTPRADRNRLSTADRGNPTACI